ncbi:MAG: hypothetical protein AB7O24_18910 [Kofleriaceae bacterium]
MTVRAIVVVVIAVGFARTARADCARDADQLRAHLVDQHRRAERWNLAWQIVFGSSTAIQLALAITETNPLGDWDRDTRERTYVNTAKAAIGFGFALAFPLKIDVPPPKTDRCIELAELRTALTRAGKNQRTAFWLNHVGGLALNLSGAALLWYRRSLSVAGISLAESVPIGLINVYTMPHGAWHRWREHEPEWAISITPSAGGLWLSAGRAW